MPRLFISQERLDNWVSDNKVELVDDRLTLEGGKKLRLVPAVHVVSVIGDETDPNDLLGPSQNEGSTQKDESRALHGFGHSGRDRISSAAGICRRNR